MLHRDSLVLCTMGVLCILAGPTAAASMTRKQMRLANRCGPVGSLPTLMESTMQYNESDTDAVCESTISSMSLAGTCPP